MRKDLSDLHNLLTEAEKFVFDETNNEFIAVWKTGKFGHLFENDYFSLFDYHAGIVEVSLSLYMPNNPYLHRGGIVAIETVDDGGWSAIPVERSFLTKEKCEEIMNKMTDKFFGVLPSVKEFEDFLNTFTKFDFYYD